VPAAAGGVHTSRGHPLDVLPAWRVLASDEDVVTDTLDRVQRHRLTVACEATVSATADVDDVMHSIAAAALTALFAAPVPHGLELIGIARELDAANQATVGRVTLTLAATFHTLAGAPEALV